MPFGAQVVVDMSIILYNKLVRDKVPEQIERSGKSCTVEVVDDDQYRALLDRKLDEEMDSLSGPPQCGRPGLPRWSSSTPPQMPGAGSGRS